MTESHVIAIIDDYIADPGKNKIVKDGLRKVEAVMFLIGLAAGMVIGYSTTVVLIGA